jgi:polyisoprenoid-binding protein YceI
MKRIKSSLLFLALICLVIAPAVAAPEVFKVDPNHSQVGFTIRHLVSRVPGHFSTYSAEITLDQDNLTASKVTAEIDTASIDTANPKRDAHLKSADFFNAEKNPKITFVSTSVVATTKEQLKVMGNLTMAGVTKPVTLDVKVLGIMPDPFGSGGKRAGFEAKTTLNRKDFGIVWNKTFDVGGTMLGDDVDVTLLVESVAAGAPKPADAKPADAKTGK